ncbi:hypothetical protein HAX54_002041 [Datura stramonium]|uniref:Uncharacterized protein n=1 Tax=Datura stramonium TaxID=4076 RepID=A0ABS8RST1_DATST|nr:hypothetical protein [Datura stramonium]
MFSLLCVHGTSGTDAHLGALHYLPAGICLVVFTPGETNAFAWPSFTQTKDRVKDYLASPENIRLNKSVKHENYLQLMVNVHEESIVKLEKMAEKKEMENLFNQLVEAEKRFDELDVGEIKGLLKIFDVKRTKLDEKRKQLN